MDNADLERRFTYHPPNRDQAISYPIIRAQALQFAQLLNTECPESREKALAITNLEQAVMWANASIARGHG